MVRSMQFYPQQMETVTGYLSNSSDSSVLTFNVLSGIEVDGKFVSVEKVSAKTVYQMLVKRKFSKPTSRKLFKKVRH